jgi:hypothetical protein
MPMAFSFSANWKSNQTVTEKTPFTSQYAAVPRWLTFSNIHLDGTYMGWQGNVQEATFENIYLRSLRRSSRRERGNGRRHRQMVPAAAPVLSEYANGRSPASEYEYHLFLRNRRRASRRRGARYRIERHQRLRQFAQAGMHDLYGEQLYKPSTRRLLGSPAFIRADGVQCVCFVRLGISQ